MLAALIQLVGLSPQVASAAARGGDTTGVSGPPDTPAKALAAARATGKPVEVLAERTETRQVFANADGTFTSETSALPERVRRGQDWVPVDATLRFADDGTVRTVATPLDLVFSGGGDAPLAGIGEGPHSVAMTWPQALPRPVLDGNTATYESVLPGVDLKITASVLGYSEVLVVKTREAALNPALEKVRFGMRATGVSVRETATGGLSAVTESGAQVFHSPAPRMWDSSGPREPAQPLTVAPRVQARQAVMGVELKPDEVSLVPDRRLLTDPNASFPLYIDPQWSGSKMAWTYVDRSFPDQEYWNSGHMPEAGNYGGGVKRSFFRMDSNNVNGKHILKATFRITQAKSWGCTSSPQAVQLWLTGGISSSTNWNRQPKWDSWQDSVSSDAGYSSSCPDKGIEFDATKAIVRAAKGGWSNTTFGLKDYDDTGSGTWGWKGFGTSPKLVIDYNTPPSAPSAVSTYPGMPCVTGTGRPHVNAGDAENRIRLTAKIYDPDKANDGVRAEFVMHHYNAATTVWDDITATLPGAGKTSYKYTTTATDHSLTAPVLQNGHSYSFKVKAYDGTDSSAWSRWCEFTVDTVDPAQLPTVTSADYPADTPDDWKGGVGTAGGFTISPGPGDSDVSAFRIALDDPNLATPATQVSLPAGQTSVTVQAAPRHDWLNTLYVYAVDRAGNVGRVPATYTFYARAGADAVGLWHLDEGSGTSAADSAGVPHPVTVAGGTGWTGGRVQGALHLDGTTGYGTTAAPVVRTDRGLTVSAWVQLSDNTKNRTVLSQAGNRGSGFQLYYSSAYKRWIFNRYDTDTDSPVLVRAIGNSEPQLNVWTHLVGVYDVPARQVRLYVNGVRQSTVGTFTTAPWNATGPLQVGRLKYDGAFQENYAGDIDEVRVWDRILSDDPRTVNDPALGNEISAMAKQPPAERGWWKLDEGAGTLAADSSPIRRDATLAGGAAWADDGYDGAAVLRLNGTTAYAATAVTPVRTDHSFAVSARVRLAGDDTCAMPDRNLTAVSLDGTRQSRFYLGYRTFTESGVVVPRWSFSATATDADTTTWTHAQAAEPADCSSLNTWTHLVGVYDEVAHQLRLYVNGQLVDQRPHTAWDSVGALQLGRAKYRGAPVDYWTGDLDDVRTYTGTLTDRQVVNLAMGLPIDN